MGNLKQRVPITSKSSNFKGETQHYVVKLPKSAGVRQYCPKILQVPGTLGTCANSSPGLLHLNFQVMISIGLWLLSGTKLVYLVKNHLI